MASLSRSPSRRPRCSLATAVSAWNPHSGRSGPTSTMVRPAGSPVASWRAITVYGCMPYSCARWSVARTRAASHSSSSWLASCGASSPARLSAATWSRCSSGVGPAQLTSEYPAEAARAESAARPAVPVRGRRCPSRAGSRSAPRPPRTTGRTPRPPSPPRRTRSAAGARRRSPARPRGAAGPYQARAAAARVPPSISRKPRCPLSRDGSSSRYHPPTPAASSSSQVSRGSPIKPVCSQPRKTRGGMTGTSGSSAALVAQEDLVAGVHPPFVLRPEPYESHAPSEPHPPAPRH